MHSPFRNINNLYFRQPREKLLLAEAAREIEWDPNRFELSIITSRLFHSGVT
jgi:hypothetical protein